MDSKGLSKVVFEEKTAYYQPIAPPIILSVNCFATRTTLYANPGARELAFSLRILRVHESGGDLYF